MALKLKSFVVLGCAGDPDDRKAMMAFRKAVSDATRKLEAQRQEWIVEQRNKRDRLRSASKAANADQRALQKVSVTELLRC